MGLRTYPWGAPEHEQERRSGQPRGGDARLARPRVGTASRRSQGWPGSASEPRAVNMNG